MSSRNADVEHPTEDQVMETKTLRKSIWSIALTAAIGLASVGAAQAHVVVPGSGYAGIATGVPGTGNSGLDAYGNTWQWNKTTGVGGPAAAGQSAWGSPGLGAGTTDLYNGSVAATDFHISFVFDPPTGTHISYAASPFAGGYNEATRFDVCSPTCVEWTVGADSDANQVNFYAPAGSALHPGDQYFVNVIMNNGASDGSNTGFTAFFTYDTVPEPVSLALLGAGLAAFGFRRRSAKTSAA
jgi:hypothetical protein